MNMKVKVAKMTQNVGRLLRKASLVFNRLQLMSGKSDHLQRTAEKSRENASLLLFQIPEDITYLSHVLKPDKLDLAFQLTKEKSWKFFILLNGHCFNPEVVSVAEVIAMRNESTTVKSLRLKVQDKNLTFKAGQWVDTFLPGLEKVGGFSMCSSPGMLKRERTLDLAVKYSEHPPAKWIHEKCTVGTELQIRVGGDVYFDPDPDKPCPDLLLIAGGIGINPIHSIFCHVTDLLDSHWTHSPKRVSLLYSASSMDELIFHEDILRHCKQKPHILSYQSFVTKESSLVNDEICGRRICREDLLKEVERMKSHDLMVFICGPPPMIHSLEEMLVSVGVQKEKVRYEKWW